MCSACDLYHRHRGEPGTCKKTPGGAGTHTGHKDTRITQTNLTSAIQTHQRTTPVTTPEAEPTDPRPTQTCTGTGSVNVNVNTTDAITGATVRHCYCPLRIHTPYITVLCTGTLHVTRQTRQPVLPVRHCYCPLSRQSTVKRHRGEPGHTRDTLGTRHTRAGGRTRGQGHTDYSITPTNLKTSQPSKPNNTQPARQRTGKKTPGGAGTGNTMCPVCVSAVSFYR